MGVIFETSFFFSSFVAFQTCLSHVCIFRRLLSQRSHSILPQHAYREAAIRKSNIYKGLQDTTKFRTTSILEIQAGQNLDCLHFYTLDSMTKYIENQKKYTNLQCFEFPRDFRRAKQPCRNCSKGCFSTFSFPLVPYTSNNDRSLIIFAPKN